VNGFEDVDGKIDVFRDSLLEIAQELAPKSNRGPIHSKLRKDRCISRLTLRKSTRTGSKK
jgi:hypothetical protein